MVHQRQERITFTTNIEFVLVLGAGVLQQQTDRLGQLQNVNFDQLSVLATMLLISILFLGLMAEFLRIK